MLKDFGLSQKETDLYLAALKLGEASLTDLAKKAGLKRPTAYLIVENLSEKGLLIKTPKKKRMFYKAESPEKLLTSWQEKKQNLEIILPKLKLLYDENSKQPKVRFYEGKAQIQKASEEMWRSKEIWAMFSPDNFLKVFTKKYSDHLFRLLIRQGGIIYDIFEDTPKARGFAKNKIRTGISQIRFLPKQKKIKTDLLVSNDKTALISFNNLSAVIIEDKDISQAQKTMLQLIWQSL